MANIIEISDISAHELLPYTDTSELELVRSGIFVAESPNVIRTALNCGYTPISLLMERKYINKT